jgi:hypothetical protein
MNKLHRTILLPLCAALAVGCSENPVEPNWGDELSASVEFAGGHLMTLTTIEFEVTVTRAGVGTFTDFAAIAIEFRMEGDTNWRATELVPHVDHFTAEKMFYTSGAYDVRVVAQVLGTQEVLTLYAPSEPLPVERIHQEVGNYVVEFETTPGHIHEGDTAEAKFWIYEAGTPVDGLVAEIVCTDADGTVEQHAPHTHTGGIYAADHIFVGAGTAYMELHFTDPLGTDLHAEFAAPISHAH